MPTLDELILHAINDAGGPVLDGLMMALGLAGLGYVWLVFTLPLLYHRYYHWFWGFILAIGAANLVVLVLKLAVGRPRPVESVILLMHDGMPSFPSGHATTAFCATTYLTAVWRRWWLTAVLFPYAALIAISRVYVGVHYPSDIIVGAAIGLAVGYGWYRLTRQRVFEHKSTPRSQTREDTVAQFLDFFSQDHGNRR